MSTQTEINWTQSVNPRNNTRDNNRHLEKNRTRFGRQNEIVYNLLKGGKVLTTMTAMMEFQIGDLQGRIRDLRKLKIDVKDKWVREEGVTRYKVYWIDENTEHDG